MDLQLQYSQYISDNNNLDFLSLSLISLKSVQHFSSCVLRAAPRTVKSTDRPTDRHRSYKAVRRETNAPQEVKVLAPKVNTSFDFPIKYICRHRVKLRGCHHPPDTLPPWQRAPAPVPGLQLVRTSWRRKCPFQSQVEPLSLIITLAATGESVHVRAVQFADTHTEFPVRIMIRKWKWTGRVTG